MKLTFLAIISMFITYELKIYISWLESPLLHAFDWYPELKHFFHELNQKNVLYMEHSNPT